MPSQKSSIDIFGKSQYWLIGLLFLFLKRAIEIRMMVKIAFILMLKPTSGHLSRVVLCARYFIVPLT
jgi:hypothetical protein